MHKQKKNTEPCKPNVLAANGQYSIQHCSCGLISVHAGPITMRLELESFFDLATTISKATAALVAESEATRIIEPQVQAILKADLDTDKTPVRLLH